MKFIFQSYNLSLKRGAGVTILNRKAVSEFLTAK